MLYIVALLILAAFPGGQAEKQENYARVAEAAGPSEAVNAVQGKGSPDLAGYTIGEQDVLDIDVWKEKEISETVVVRPDGKIAIPLVNEIYVVGMTPRQLQELLAQKLEPFVTVPQVTVSVREIHSRKVYVTGQVAHPGVLHINSTTTVYEIISEAGGLKDFAKRKKIYVLRKADGKEIRIPFNYDAFIKGHPDGKDIVLQPGDSVVVP